MGVFFYPVSCVLLKRFYRMKEEFRQAIRKFFDNIGDYKKEELGSLLTLKFRLCNSQTIYK